MNPDLVQVAPQPEAPCDSNLRKIAELLGLSVVCVPGIEEALSLSENAVESRAPLAFLVNAAVLSPSDRRLNIFVIEALRNRGRWLVYGLAEGVEPPAEWARYFGNALPGTMVKKSRSQTVRFGRGVPFLGDREYGSSRSGRHTVFNAAVRHPVKTWVTVNADPLLVSTPRGSDEAHDYFLASSADDVASPLAPPDLPEARYTGILPAAVALRGICGDRCWFNPWPTGCVVVDGPSLRERSGSFDYARVLAELKARNYAATVALVPCTYRRSDRALAARLAAQAERFSICVHGCYGTRDEFAGTREDALTRAGLALRYMERHAELTHLPFDRTMVFRDNAYSEAALEALGAFEYLAAVSSAPYGAGPSAAPCAVGDSFDLAIQRHANVPVFTRHSPRGAFDFAVDLFLGKPVLVAAHQGLFRHGTAPMSRVVRAINAINDLGSPTPIAWKPLQEALVSAGRYRVRAVGQFEVQFATARFRIANPLNAEALFDCWKREFLPDDVESVTVNGAPCPYSIEDNRLRLRVGLKAHEQGIVQVHRRSRPPKPGTPNPFLALNAGLRRRVFELRTALSARFGKG